MRYVARIVGDFMIREEDWFPPLLTRYLEEDWGLQDSTEEI
jgi:hypothetical protein